MTFRSEVDVKANFLGTMASQQGRLHLNVHGDAFEVFHPFPLARFLFGQDYCYRAQGTTVEMVPGVLHDWMPLGHERRLGLGD